jgi:hypothetical protein
MTEKRDDETMTQFTMRKIREEIIDECARCVPTNWCDSLLTGPSKVGNLPGRETEALLRGIQDRIHALKVTNGDR